MIKIDNIYNQDKNAGFEHYAIMRSLRPNLRKPGLIHMPVLAPSLDLYHWFIRKKDDGLWTMECFDQEYVPAFIGELKHNPDAINTLKMLYDHSFIQDIALYCTCTSERQCHRSIVGGILLGSGAQVDCNPEYAKYWDMFKQA